MTKEQVALEERRLLQPFSSGGEVGCGSLVIEASANFYAHVAQPTVDPKIHGARKEPGPGYTDTIWINKIGDQRGAFTITVGPPDEFTDKGIVRGGAMKFTVLNELRLRMFEGEHAMALNATAKGKPLVLVERGKPVRDLAEFEIHDGVLRAQ